MISLLMFPSFSNLRVTQSIESIGARVAVRSSGLATSSTNQTLRVSDGLAIQFAGANSRDLLDVLNENLAVPKLPRSSFLQDGLEHLLRMIGGDEHFDLEFGNEFHFIFRAAIDRALSPLSSITLHLRDGEAGDADRVQRVPHFVKSERLDDRGDLFHWILACSFLGFRTPASACYGSISP